MSDLERRVARLTAILDVAKAMTEEREIDRLLRLVVAEATKVVESERSTLYVYDREREELWSKVAEGATELRFPANTGIAGAVATTGEISNIRDAYDDPRFNRSFDERSGFRTRSILTVPMRNSRGEVVGVLQTLNKKGDQAFGKEDEELLLALAGVAGAAITNALLHEDIEKLFEGFANAAVVAIESRDPTTAGHSGRVAQVSVGLAHASQRIARGRWAGLTFNRDQLQELRYAALLHDFGKVGVREHVLVKANKLYPGDLDTLEQRFETIRRTIELQATQRKLDLALAGGPRLEEALAAEDAALRQKLVELDRMLEFIHDANQPTVLAQGSFEKLYEIAARTFPDTRGAPHNYLSPREVQLLSIRKGSLAAEERDEIESHVSHTYRFLSQIPWTRALRNVPEIAFGHHEKLTGGGYPRGLSERDIPPQTRMITIADIYDALTASDRPYKRAMSHERALDILHAEAREGHIDADLLQVFVEADVARTARPLTIV